MSTEGSVTRLIDALQEGSPEAARKLWQLYSRRLVALARMKLRDAPRRVADEDDVAQNAFASLCHNAELGRFPDLQDRDSLWRLLAVIIARKAAHQVRDECRQKRGGGRAPDADDDALLLDQMLSHEPSPEQAAEVAEEYQRLLALLADKELEAIAIGRLEGYTVEEIAGKLGYAPHSIKRKLKLIRGLWKQETPP